MLTLTSRISKLKLCSEGCFQRVASRSQSHLEEDCWFRRAAIQTCYANLILRTSTSSKLMSESSERKWADLDEPHIETTSKFPEVCCFQEVASWIQNLPKGSVLISTSRMSRPQLYFETSAVQISVRDSWQDCCWFFAGLLERLQKARWSERVCGRVRGLTSSF